MFGKSFKAFWKIEGWEVYQCEFVAWHLGRIGIGTEPVKGFYRWLPEHCLRYGRWERLGSYSSRLDGEVVVSKCHTRCEK